MLSVVVKLIEQKINGWAERVFSNLQKMTLNVAGMTFPKAV